MKNIACSFLVLFLCLGSASLAMATEGEGIHRSDANTGLQLVDALLVRPCGVVVSTVTSAVYVGTSPLTFLMDVDEQAGDALVSIPWRFTAGRELGRF
jgi:hypothetical protein